MPRQRQRQRQRLLRAAPLEFAEHGYAGASSESISRRAGMSKAAFYEHFVNKVECMLALLHWAAEVVAGAMASAARAASATDAVGGLKVGARAFLETIAEYPEFVQTLLVEIIGAGPRAATRRDEVMQAFADALDAENARAARRRLGPRFASSLDSFADMIELAPVIDRVIEGVLALGAQ